MTHSRRPGSSSITPLSERLKTPVRRREKTYISLVYIADGFADDCDEFIHCCTKEDEKLTYPVFAQYWHEMNFSSLYEGRSCGAEIAELSEEVIRIAKHYMLADTSNFEENVCGLFLVYALLNLQPYTNLACLRIVPEDMNAINHIEAVARRDKRLDVLYILGSVLVKGPVQYHADNRERGMDGAIKKYLEDGCMTIDNLGVRPKGVFYRQNPVLDTLRDMKNAYRKYDAIKSLIKTSADINYVKIKDAEDLEASHKQLINGIREPAAVPTAVVPEERYQSVREIKAKAMKNTVNSIKHRTGVQERSKNEPASPQKPDIRSKPGKVKSGSPKKPLTTNSPRKPKMQQKYSPKAKKQKKQKNVRKRKYYSSSDSDSDVTIKLDDGDLTDDDGNDLDLDEYIERLQRKEKAQKDEVSEEKVNKEELVTQELDTQKVDTQELNMQELNMQLDTLPIYIRSAGDEDIEIEIIDEHVNSSSGENRTKRKKKVAQAKVMSLPDISFQNIDDTVPTENISEQIGLSSAPLANVSKITKNDDAVFKKPSSVINPKLKAKTIHNEPQPSTSKETMELIKKRNDITPNVKNNSPRKAYKNTVTPGSVTISQSIDTSPEKNIDTPARVNRSRSKDMSPEENTDTPAIVTRSRSKDLSPESNSNEPKVKSKDTISIRKEIIPGNKNTKSKIFQMADTDSMPNKEIPELDKYKKKAKADEDGCIIQLPEDIPRNRKPQFSSTTPIHIGDVDMIEKYLPIHGRTKRVLWNKQDPTVGKSFRGTSLTISVGSISSIDSMTTVFHETDENFDYKVNNKSPNAKEHADKSSHDLHATTGDKNRIKSVERTQMSLPDVNCTTIDERHSESNENSETSLPDLNSISPNIGNMAARKKIQMTLPASSSHSKASKNNIKAKTKTKMGLPDLNSTTVEHFHNKNNMTLNEKTGINLTEFTSLDKSRKDNENIAMSLPDLNFSMVGLSKEISLPDLNLTTTDCNKNMPTKRLAKTPTNTKVPAKKYKSASTTVQAVHCRDINTPDRNKTRTRLVSSDKSLEMSNLDAVEGMVRVTRSSKVSSENKISNNEVFDKSKSNLTLTPILKKPEKRQQKQIHRKSKFKKMGIVEIADLDTDRTA